VHRTWWAKCWNLMIVSSVKNCLVLFVFNNKIFKIEFFHYFLNDDFRVRKKSFL
jgi:hypothetical protein